jgi:GNAT superfamily N-acetyltransferase
VGAQAPIALRDGRLVTLAAAQAGDAGEIPLLLAAAGDPRGEAFARAGEADTLVARALESGALVGYAAWIGAGDHADFFCAVEPTLQGLGLGTLLLRAAASAAAGDGMRALRRAPSAGTGARSDAARLRASIALGPRAPARARRHPARTAAPRLGNPVGQGPRALHSIASIG